MLVDEKPPLDEDLLMHFGIKGMKWGQRKQYIPTGRQSGGGSASTSSNIRQPAGSKAVAPHSHHMSTGMKVALGVGGVAIGAYLLSKTGTRPHAQSMTSRSNAAGLKVAVGLLKRSGSMTVKAGKVIPKAGFKTGKVVGKAGFKTGKVVGKGVGKVTVSSSKSLIESVKKIKLTGGEKSAVSGERFGKLLLGEYGPKSFRPSGTAGAIIIPQHIRRRSSP